MTAEWGWRARGQWMFCLWKGGGEKGGGEGGLRLLRRGGVGGTCGEDGWGS